MVQFVPLSRDRHGGKACNQFANYAFAADRTVVPLVAAEFLNAARIMPIAFVEQSGEFVPVAVMSLTRGRNSFVGGDGRWIGRYIPAAFRNYPFSLLRRGSAEEWILCVDETSPAIVDREGDAAPLFDDTGELSASMKQRLEVLRAVEKNRRATAAAMSALKAAGVIRPWEICRKIEGQERMLRGLYCVDQAALEGLGDLALAAVNKARGLMLAYTQILSMDQLDVLEMLARREMGLEKPRAGQAGPGEGFGLTTENSLHFG